MASGAGLAACRRGQSEQAPEFFISVAEVSALGAVERVAEGGQRRGGALGLAEGTPGVQTCNTGSDEDSTTGTKKTTGSGLILKNAILRVLNMFVLHAGTR